MISLYLMKFVWEINGDFLKEPNYHYVQYH